MSTISASWKNNERFTVTTFPHWANKLAVGYNIFDHTKATRNQVISPKHLARIASKLQAQVIELQEEIQAMRRAAAIVAVESLILDEEELSEIMEVF